MSAEWWGRGTDALNGAVPAAFSPGGTQWGRIAPVSAALSAVHVSSYEQLSWHARSPLEQLQKGKIVFLCRSQDILHVTKCHTIKYAI